MANEKRLIDANALVDKLEDLKSKLYGWEDYNTGVDSAVYQTENAPTVDAVEVVRCKDCKHYALWEDSETRMTCSIVTGLMNNKPDDFCSYGERKDNDR